MYISPGQAFFWTGLVYHEELELVIKRKVAGARLGHENGFDVTSYGTLRRLEF